MSQPGTFGQPKSDDQHFEIHDQPKFDLFEDESAQKDKDKRIVMAWADDRSESIPDYKFNEDNLIVELKEYIDSTYEGHYSKNKFQSMEFIVDCGHGDGFCMGNIIKYAQRYGKKNGKNRKDLLKIMHYAIIALSVLDDELNGENDNEDM
jgi:hypothetical protein